MMMPVSADAFVDVKKPSAALHLPMKESENAAERRLVPVSEGLK